MMKVVLKLSYFDDKIKTKAMKKVSSLSGLDSISFDPKEQKMTVTGEIDPVTVTSKLRKICPADVISVGPAKEPEKKKDEPNKNDGAKDIKAQPSMWMPMYYNEHPVYYHHLPPHQYQHQQQYAMQMPYYGRSVVEEDPNSCLIS